jgi:hypothetical protein
MISSIDGSSSSSAFLTTRVAVTPGRLRIDISAETARGRFGVTTVFRVSIAGPALGLTSYLISFLISRLISRLISFFILRGAFYKGFYRGFRGIFFFTGLGDKKSSSSLGLGIQYSYNEYTFLLPTFLKK